MLRARVSRDNQTPVVIRQRSQPGGGACCASSSCSSCPRTTTCSSPTILGDAQLPPAPVFADAGVAESRRRWGRPRRPCRRCRRAPLPERNAVAEAATVVRLREAALQGGRGGADAERQLQLDLQPHRLSERRLSHLRPRELVSRGRVERARSSPADGRRATRWWRAPTSQQAQLQLKQVQELAALDTRSAWAELVAARAAWESSAGHGAAGDARVRDCRRPLPDRRVHAARAVGLATAAAAGRGQSRAGRARPAGGPRQGGAAARTSARRRHQPGAARPAVGQAPQPAPTPQQQQQGRGQFTSATAQGQPQTGTR